MLGLYVYLGRKRSKRFVIAKQAVAIGSDEKNDLVLRDGEVAPFHCRLIYSHDRWFLSPPDDGGAAAMRPLEDGAELPAGAYTIVLAIHEPRRDPVEQGLIDQLVAGDHTSRLVYADWLEDRGRLEQAEFLRLQQTLAEVDPADAAARLRLRAELRRLRELAGKLDVEWRRLVGRPLVEGCRKTTFDVECRMDWGSLAPTAQPDVRRCNMCGDDVYYATTTFDARAHARLGRCVAVDLVEERAPGDLNDPQPRLGYIA